jgi:hypothetical protein
MNVWGVHNNVLTNELTDEGFISIGWDELDSLSDISGGREGLKARLSELNPDAKPRSIAGQAGTLVRFRDDMQVGDVIVAPSPARTITRPTRPSIGTGTGSSGSSLACRGLCSRSRRSTRSGLSLPSSGFEITPTNSWPHWTAPASRSSRFQRLSRRRPSNRRPQMTRMMSRGPRA